MAIKVNGTEVISNTRKFTVTGATGVYTDFQPLSVTTTSDYGGSAFSVSFDSSHKDLGTSAQATGDVDWTLTSLGTGKQMTMFVDASDSGHDQSFSVSGGGTILYPNDTEPTWTGARYWLHRLTCWSADTVSVISTSWGDGPTVSLPSAIDISANSGTQSGNCNCVVRLNSTGTLSLTGSGTQGSVNGAQNNGYTWLLSGSASDYECNFNYTFTNNGGADQSTAGNNTWEGLGTSREWKIYDASTNASNNVLDGTLKIRRASDQTELVSIPCELTAHHTPQELNMKTGQLRQVKISSTNANNEIVDTYHMIPEHDDEIENEQQLMKKMYQLVDAKRGSEE